MVEWVDPSGHAQTQTRLPARSASVQVDRACDSWTIRPLAAVAASRRALTCSRATTRRCPSRAAAAWPRRAPASISLPALVIPGAFAIASAKRAASLSDPTRKAAVAPPCNTTQSLTPWAARKPCQPCSLMLVLWVCAPISSAAERMRMSRATQDSCRRSHHEPPDRGSTTAPAVYG
jgi:hypothetical protein